MAATGRTPAKRRAPDTDRPRVRTYEATMDYVRAEDFQDEAAREAGGDHVQLPAPEDEDLAAREDLRELVGRRRDRSPTEIPPVEPADVTGVSAEVGLQRLSGKTSFAQLKHTCPLLVLHRHGPSPPGAHREHHQPHQDDRPNPEAPHGRSPPSQQGRQGDPPRGTRGKERRRRGIKRAALHPRHHHNGPSVG